MRKVQLPIGFRFMPTDEEIINTFVQKKINGESLPHDYVVECDIYGDKEPWKIFDKHLKQSFYVFAKLKKKSKAMIKRTAGCGTWIGQNSDNVVDGEGRIIGYKKLLVFEIAKGVSSYNNGRWIMHEFSLIGGERRVDQNGIDVYVLCRIRNKDMDKVAITVTCLVFEVTSINVTVNQATEANDCMKLKVRKFEPEGEENQQQKRIRYGPGKFYPAANQPQSDGLFDACLPILPPTSSPSGMLVPTADSVSIDNKDFDWRSLLED